jgi:hypothetical protein
VPGRQHREKLKDAVCLVVHSWRGSFVFLVFKSDFGFDFWFLNKKK